MSSFLKTRDVAKLFDVEMGTVLAWVETGTIPPDCYFRLGGTPRGRLRFHAYRIFDLVESWQPGYLDSWNNANGPAPPKRPEPGTRRMSPDAPRTLRALQ